MRQVTTRVPEALLDRIRRAADERNISVNEFITRTMDAATNPELAGSEAERLRARLEAAGLTMSPATFDRVPPARHLVETARRAAGDGTPLAEIVSADRG